MHRPLGGGRRLVRERVGRLGVARFQWLHAKFLTAALRFPADFSKRTFFLATCPAHPHSLPVSLPFALSPMEEACCCAICHDIFVDCVEPSCCPIGYCRECITRFLRVRSRCLTCPKAISAQSLRPNKVAQRIADAIPMGPCENKGGGTRRSTS